MLQQSIVHLGHAYPALIYLLIALFFRFYRHIWTMSMLHEAIILYLYLETSINDDTGVGHLARSKDIRTRASSNLSEPCRYSWNHSYDTLKLIYIIFIIQIHTKVVLQEWVVQFARIHARVTQAIVSAARTAFAVIRLAPLCALNVKMAATAVAPVTAMVVAVVNRRDVYLFGGLIL